MLEAHVTTNPPWTWSENGIQFGSLGIYCQVGAVLLTGCLGGKNAGILSQIAYIFVGLFWLPVFTQGGKLSYLMEPTFGYILGFVPAAGGCGWLALSIQTYPLSIQSGRSTLLDLRTHKSVNQATVSMMRAMM